MRLEAMWKTAKVRPDFLRLSLELAQPFMSQMLPLKGLTGLQKQVTAISFFFIGVFKHFSIEFLSVFTFGDN